MIHTNAGDQRRCKSREENQEDYFYGESGRKVVLPPHKILEAKFPVYYGKGRWREWVICPRCMAQHTGTATGGSQNYSGGWLPVTVIDKSTDLRIYVIGTACSCAVGSIRSRVSFGRPVPFFDRIQGTDQSDTLDVCVWQREIIVAWYHADDARLKCPNYLTLAFALARQRCQPNHTSTDDAEFLKAFIGEEGETDG